MLAVHIDVIVNLEQSVMHTTVDVNHLQNALMMMTVLQPQNAQKSMEHLSALMHVQEYNVGQMQNVLQISTWDYADVELAIAVMPMKLE